jgi:hypothetical protein
MSDEINAPRRKLIGATALGLVAAQLGAAPAFAQNNAPKRGIAASGSFGPLKRVNAGVLSIAYAEAEPANGPPVLLLHGWPYDIHSFADVAPILANAGYRVLIRSRCRRSRWKAMRTARRTATQAFTPGNTQAYMNIATLPAA